MINQKVRDIMNEQIKWELYSSYLYLAMAAYFDSQGLDGMGQWMRAQAQEEVLHAMKFFNHIKDRDGRVELLAIDQPPSGWSSPAEVFKVAYEHEQKVTGLINNIMKVAQEENDFAAMPMLHWFVDEQIEEEASTSKVAQELKRIGDSGDGIIMLDRELGTRIFTLPPVGGEGA